MYSNLNSKTQELTNYNKWEDFVHTVKLYYHSGNKYSLSRDPLDSTFFSRTTILPTYTEVGLLEKPHSYVNITDEQHSQVVRLIKHLFDNNQHIITIVNSQKPFNGNNLSLNQLFSCVDDNQRISLYKSFKQGIKRSNHLVGVVNFRIQVTADDLLLTAIYESFTAYKPEDKGSIILNRINRYRTITNFLEEV